MRGTWEVDLVPEVASEVRPEDSVFIKHRASCFFDSPLDTELRMRGVRRLIICGVTTNFFDIGIDSVVPPGFLAQLVFPFTMRTSAVQEETIHAD